MTIVAGQPELTGERAAVIVGSFVFVSLEPCLVGFFVSHESRTWPQLNKATVLGISTLATTHTVFGQALVGEALSSAASALTALFQLAMAQTYSGDLDTALNTCRESLELSSRHGERRTHACSLWITALCRWHLGQMGQSRKAAIEALEIQQDFKDSICAALTIELLSWIAASESRFDSAAELANAVTGWRSWQRSSRP